MTVPPPPAVPGELIEKAAAALNLAEFGEQSGFGPQERHRIDAEQVLAAVYGDIAEAARRDVLTAASEAIEASPMRFYSDMRHGLARAVRIVTDLRDGTAPRDGLSATHADPTPVPRIPGTPERSQGHSGPRAACRACSDYHRTGSAGPAPVRDADEPQNAVQPLAARPTMRPYWHGSQPGGTT